jgi:hypothetical protein
VTDLIKIKNKHMKTKIIVSENKNCIKVSLVLLLLLFMNNAKAQLSFTSGQSLGSFNNITVGDVNGDGYPDIVALYYKAANKIWLNDGNGKFTSSDSLGTGGNAVDLADLDGDGDLDAFIVDGGYMNVGKPATVWMNDGKGNFTNSGQQLGSKYSTDVALADLDGDGDIDAFVCNHAFENLTNGGNQVWLNDGKGVFTNSVQLPGNAFDVSVHLGDIDNDNDIDALVTSNSNWTGATNENKIYINDGKAHFTKKVLSNPYSNDLALADIDKDGDLDIVIVYENYVNNSNIGAKLFINDGIGNFTAGTQSFDDIHIHGIELGDLNNDGNIDAMFAYGKYFTDTPNKTWLGDGKVGFTKTDLSFGADDGIFVKLADFNNDKLIDAIVGNKIWFNTTDTTKTTVIVSKLKNKKIEIYPNPTNGLLKISLITNAGLQTFVEIYNLLGIQVFSKTFQYTTSAAIDLTYFSEGMYIVKIIAGRVHYEDMVIKK